MKPNISRPNIILDKNPFEKRTYEWIKPLDSLLQWEMDNRLIKKDKKYYLPAGSLLYHGSLYESEFNKNTITFFSLDYQMALWYILEMLELSERKLTYLQKKFAKPHWMKDEIPDYGYLYVFETKKDLPVTIMNNIFDNPKGGFKLFGLDFSKCKNKVCFHPQISFRGDPINHKKSFEMFIEITMNMSNEKYNDSLDLINVLIVDPYILKDNRDNYQWDPKNSIKGS